MKSPIMKNSALLWATFFACTLMLLQYPAPGSAQEIAPQISYQGRILNAAGQPLAGPVDMEIAIYQSDTDPSPSYRESHSAVPLEDGIYSILIGRGTVLEGALNADIFSGGTAMLEVTVNGEALTPRQPFASSAYAFRSLATAAQNIDIQGSFRVQAGSQYFSLSANDVANTAPRCECDTDVLTQECAASFFGTQDIGTTCYDWYDDYNYGGSFHRARANRYTKSSPPVSLAVDPSTGTVESETSFRVVSSEPTLVLRDTDGGGIRPRIRFENNGIAAFEGDDGGDQYFNFYSTFLNNRTNSAHLRVYGAATGSWEKYTELSHDGTKGTVSTDTGDLVLQTTEKIGRIKLVPGHLGRVDIARGFGLEFPDGTLQTTAYRGYPRPAYDSGWRTVPNGNWDTVTLNHNLGGNVDNYVVELTFKNDGGAHNKGIGGDVHTVPAGSENEGRWGKWWHSLTSTSIKVTDFENFPFLQGQEYFRVRIWVYE
ncbi:MAG: hypothetical protein L3J49_04330 [Desulfobulbaceae bacterium]|nr:hypothetical protein [Desulfobulbaceae bacterium]